MREQSRTDRSGSRMLVILQLTLNTLALQREDDDYNSNTPFVQLFEGRRVSYVFEGILAVCRDVELSNWRRKEKFEKVFLKVRFACGLSEN
jgi:hypothetical protein